MDISRKQIPNGTWASPLCDCLDDLVSCIEVCWCPHCQITSQYGMLHHNSTGVDPMCYLALCFGDIFTSGLAGCCVNCRNRGEIRRRFFIQGSDCNDRCTVCFCYPCSVAQQYREMTYRGIWPGGCVVSPPIGAALAPPLMGQQQQYAPQPGQQQYISQNQQQYPQQQQQQQQQYPQQS